MKSLILTFCAALSVFSATGGWENSWHDEFNGSAVDAALWGYELGYVRNNEQQYYTDRPANSRIDKGTLLIQALRETNNGYQYTSASRQTKEKRSMLYGRFEMRAKIDIRPGSWPAWWWLPNTGGWPKGGEIDMMEYYTGKCLFNVMDGTRKWSSTTRSITTLGGPSWAESYHVWTMEWDSTRIDLFLDGTLINHYSVAKADGTGPGGSNPFRQPGYFILNQAIGGTNGGDPSATVFPVDFRIDWIRTHTWSKAPSVLLTVVNGAGTGPYIPGTTASITATNPTGGRIFDKWVMSSGSAVIDSISSPSAKLLIPSANITVTATYRTAVAGLLRPPSLANNHLDLPVGPDWRVDVLGRCLTARLKPSMAPAIKKTEIILQTR